jgi:hypothetical protein
VTGKQNYREAPIANVVKRVLDDPTTLQRKVKGWGPVAERPICLDEFEAKMEAHCAYIENHPNVIWEEVSHGRRENGPDELCMQFHANLWATVIDDNWQMEPGSLCRSRLTGAKKAIPPRTKERRKVS